MPIRTYTCNKCQKNKRILNPQGDILCECGSIMQKDLPDLAKPVCMEKLDDLRNKQLPKGFQQELKARSKKHFYECEIANKADEAGTTGAIENGWLNQNGKLKKFEDLK